MYKRQVQQFVNELVYLAGVDAAEITRLEGELAAANEALTTAQAEIEQRLGEIYDRNVQITAMETTIAGLNNDVTRLTTQVETLSADISKMQSDFSAAVTSTLQDGGAYTFDASTPISEVVQHVYNAGSADALEAVTGLQIALDVGMITAADITALTQSANEVADWKSLQAAIDASATVNSNSWLQGVDLSNGTPTSTAGFTTAYSGSYQNGYTSSQAYSISDVDNTARATFILGDHDANGDNVLQDSEVGVVIYSTNEDLLPLGTNSADIDVEGGYSTAHAKVSMSDYVTINTGNSVQVIIESGYNADTGLFDICLLYTSPSPRDS